MGNSNPNNSTSIYYNIVSEILRPQELTDKEISLITRLLPKGSTILDIGAGTGRHSIQLAQNGYIVTALDSSEEMLRVLKENSRGLKIKTVHKDVLQFNTIQKFDLVSLFWNSFNEIVLTKKDAIKILKKFKEMLNENGKILINIDDSNVVSPQDFDFKNETWQSNLLYKYSWKTQKYNKKTNTSTSLESIKVYKDDKLIDTKEATIKQRYWSLEEIKRIATDLGFSIENQNINISTELYLLLSIN